jgi:hypothetical protein
MVMRTLFLVPLLALGEVSLSFNDTGTPGSSFEPGGRVRFAANDSVGQRSPKPANWSSFDSFVGELRNDEACSMLLVIRHAGTTNYRSRVDHEITLPVGKSTVRVPLGELRNNDGSAPDLSRVSHWYLHNTGAARSLEIRRLYLSSIADSAAPAGPPPDDAVPFHTPEADAILAELQVFPKDDPWHQDIRKWPRHPRSDHIVASVGLDKPLRYNPDMAFVIVPPHQPRVPVRVLAYPGESDPGPFPLPSGVPIEGWPGYAKHGPNALLDLQWDRAGRGGDRHAIVVDPGNGKLHEFFQLRRTAAGWTASQASTFDLRTNKPRPAGWTSADAAGLPIFPAVVRYDELARGVIDHALRVTVRKSRRAYVAPASHFASRHTNPDYPRMGERFRLRADFDTSSFSREVRIILEALKTYGMLVADNGIEWALSVAPDPRIPILHEELRRVRGRDFEVVQYTPME